MDLFSGAYWPKDSWLSICFWKCSVAYLRATRGLTYLIFERLERQKLFFPFFFLNGWVHLQQAMNFYTDIFVLQNGPLRYIYLQDPRVSRPHGHGGTH